MNSYRRYSEEEIIEKLQRITYDDEDTDEEVYGASKYRPPRPDHHILSGYKAVKTKTEGEIEDSEFLESTASAVSDDKYPKSVWVGRGVSKSYADVLSYVEINYPQTFEAINFSSVTRLDSFAFNLLGEFVTWVIEKRVEHLNFEEIDDYKIVMDNLEALNFKMEWIRAPIEKLEKAMYLIPCDILHLKTQALEKKIELKKLRAEYADTLLVGDVWKGHEVSKSFVDVLSYINIYYPQTFEGVKFSTTAFHNCDLLREFVTVLVEKRVKNLDFEEIQEYKNVMADLEAMNFKIDWIREPIEKLEKAIYVIPREICHLKRTLEKTAELKKLQAEFSYVQRVGELFKGTEMSSFTL